MRPPNPRLEDDVTTVRAVAFDLASAGHPIIVLAHSYSGLVASEAVTEELYAKHGNAGVVGLIYMSAWMIQLKSALPQSFEKNGYQSNLELAAGFAGSKPRLGWEVIVR